MMVDYCHSMKPYTGVDLIEFLKESSSRKIYYVGVGGEESFFIEEFK